MHLIRWAILAIVLLCAACRQDQKGVPPRAEPADADANCPADLIPAADNDYGKALIAHIDSAKFYLKLVSARHLSGTPMLCVQLRRDGSLLRVYVSESSGFALIDGSALYAVGRAFSKSSMPSIPRELAGGADSAWFVVAVRFDDVAASDGSLPIATPPCVSVKKTYVDDLQAAIQKRIFYPFEARYRGEEASTGVQFNITPDARLTNVKITATAGDPLFDAAALITVGFVDVSAERPCRELVVPVAADEDARLKIPINWKLLN